MNSKSFKLKVLSAAMCLSVIAGTASMGIVANAAEASTPTTSSSTQLGAPLFKTTESGVTYTGCVESGIVKIINIETSGTSLTLKNNFANGQPIYIVQGAISSTSCPNLRTLTIPKNIYSIQKGAFSSCKKLQSIIVANDNTKLRIGENILSNLKVVYVNSKLLSNFSTYFKIHNSKSSTGTYTDSFKKYPCITNVVNITSPYKFTQDTANSNQFYTAVKRDMKVNISTNITDDKTRTAQYAFACKGPKDTAYVVKQNWSTKSNYTYNFTTSGTYTIRMSVKDDKGTVRNQYRVMVVEEQRLKSATVTVSGKTYNLTTDEVNGKIEMGNKAVFKVETKDKNTKYQIRYKRDSSTKWSILKDYDANASQSYNIKPQVSVPYTMQIITKTAHGLTSTRTIKFTPVSGNMTVSFPSRIKGCEVRLINAASKVVAQKVSNGKSVVFDNLPFGKYTIDVVQAPAGYILPDQRISVVLNSESSKCNVVCPVYEDIGPVIAYSDIVFSGSPKFEGVNIVITDENGQEVAEAEIDRIGNAYASLLSGHKYTARYKSIPTGYSKDFANSVKFETTGPQVGVCLPMPLEEGSIVFLNAESKFNIKGTSKLGKSIDITVSPDVNGQIITTLPYGTYSVTPIGLEFYLPLESVTFTLETGKIIVDCQSAEIMY